MNLISLNFLYYVIGAVIAFVAIRIGMNKDHPTRFGSALFWGIFAVTLMFGQLIPPVVTGYLVLIMTAIAAFGKAKSFKHQEVSKEKRERHALQLKNKIFIPALLIPVITVVGSLVFGKIHFGNVNLIDGSNSALIAVGIGAIVALIVAKIMTKSKWGESVQEATRLTESVGWPILLPQLLAALGTIFSIAGVGKVVSNLVSHVLPTQYAFVAVVAYCIGMAVFTMIMGNAFAAFAVITGGIGLPLIVHMHGGNPGIMAAIGMFAGYCGTLMTPMAANFNIVPALLLDLKDKNAVIKRQIPIGLPLLALNILFMYVLVYNVKF